MKNRTKILLGTALSIMLMGGAYATWTDGFIVKTDVDTYSFEGEVITIDSSGSESADEINDSLEATATVKLSDASAEVKIKNTGSVPIYIEDVKIKYVANYNMDNVNNYAAIKTLVFDESGNDGSTDKRMDIDVSDLIDGTTPDEVEVAVGKDIFRIEPKPREDGVSDESERTIEWSRGLSLGDLTSEWDDKVRELTEDIANVQNDIDSAGPDDDTDGDERRKSDLEERLQEVENIIEDIKQAFEQDEIELEFHFKMSEIDK